MADRGRAVPVPAAPPAAGADQRPGTATAAERSGAAWAGRAVVLGCVAWIVGVLAMRWPALLRPTMHSVSTVDAAVYALAGDLLRRGGAPYLAFWDHKPPLIHLVNALALTVSGGSPWGPWAASAIGFGAAVLLCHAAIGRLLGPPAALFGVVCFAFSLPTILAANMPEGYAVPLQWAAVLAVATHDWGERGRPFVLGALLAVIGAAAFFLKPTLAGAAVVAALVLVATLAARRRWAALGRVAAGGAAGTAASVGIAVLYLASQGSLDAFAEQVLRYNFAYAAKTELALRVRAAKYGVLLAGGRVPLAFAAAGWLLAAAHLARAVRRRGPARPSLPALALALVWLPAELLLATTSGRSYPNYFALLFAPASLLAAVVAAEIAALVRGAPVREARRGDAAGEGGGVVAALAAAVAVSAAVPTVLLDLAERPTAAAREAQVARAVAYVGAHTAASDAIFVWGHAADIYLLSERRPASRFIYPLPLLTPGYADSALVAGFLAELERARPALVVGVSGRGLEGEILTPPLDRFDAAWQLPLRGPPDNWTGEPHWTMTPALAAFYAYVERNYVLAERIGGRWPVYRRRDAAGVALAPRGSPVSADRRGSQHP